MIVRGSSAQIQPGTIARGKIFVNIYLDIECQTATILYDLANEYYAKQNEYLHKFSNTILGFADVSLKLYCINNLESMNIADNKDIAVLL